MCGIVALWNRDGRPIDLPALERAVASLARRGPDDEGYLLIDTRSGRRVACVGSRSRPDLDLPHISDLHGQSFDLAMGHRRLAILDLSALGHQPMTSPDGRLSLVFNGMIYNHRELRARLEAEGVAIRGRCDTEVLLATLATWGPASLELLNGMWAFASWDQNRRALTLCRDRLGIKPLVYHLSERQVACGSEIGALHHLGIDGGDLDPQALHHYLSFMQVPAPYTIYERFRKLAPATCLRVSETALEERIFWSAEAAEAAETGAAAPDGAATRDAAERLEELLRDSVRLRLEGDVPVGSLLSGGVDSSLISALAAQQRAPERLRTFSVVLPDMPDHDESRWSRAVASHLDTEHTELDPRIDPQSLGELLGVFSEPFAVSSVLGIYRIAELARDSVRVLLSGDGGDEVFAGYDRYVGHDERWTSWSSGPRGLLSRARAAAQQRPVRWRRESRLAKGWRAVGSLAAGGEGGRERNFHRSRALFRDSEKWALYAEGWQPRVDDTVAWLSARPGRSDGRDVDLVKRRQLQEIATTLHDEMLAKVDRATMAWGVEGRVPLLDHRVVELAMTLPIERRIDGDQTKVALRDVARRHLPQAVVDRRKLGFNVPLARWLDGELAELVADALSPAAVRRSGVFDPGAVAEVLAYRGRERGYHSSHMVLTLLCFQLWHEQASRPRTP